MGKISVNEIDFDELDDVVADILHEKEQPAEPKPVEVESGPTEVGSVGVVVEVETPANGSPEELESVEVIEETVVGEENAAPWRIVQRARKMHNMSASERAEHETIRTTKRFAKSLRPLEPVLNADNVSNDAKSVSAVHDVAQPRSEEGISLYYTTLLAESQGVLGKKPAKIEEKVRTTDEKEDEEIKLQQEILWEITKDLKGKGERKSAATTLHKTATKTIAVANKPKMLKMMRPDVIPPAKLARAKMATKPRKTTTVKVLRQDNLEKIVPKSESMQFAGDEYSEDIDEKKAVTKHQPDTPFIGGIKVNKKPLGVEGGEEKTKTVVSGSSLDDLLPKVKEPKLGASRTMKVPLGFSSKQKVASPNRPKVVNKKNKEERVSFWFWVIFCAAAVLMGVVIGVVAFWLANML